MRKLFYSKLIYITIMFFFIFTGLKMEDPLYQQGKILGRNFKVIYQYFSEEENGGGF
jgi:hypothetical protein